MLGHRRVVVGGVIFTASLAAWIAVALTHVDSFWHQIDASAFRAAGAYTWHPTGHLYDEPLGAGHLHYIYPPFGAIVFAPFSWLPFAGWKLALIVLDVLLLAYCAHASMRLAGVTARSDRLAATLALSALGLWLEPFDSTVGFGQSNLILLALVLADLAAPPSRRWRGVLIGVAAGIKLTPLLFVVYLLCTRQRRSAVVAGATFLATVVAGAAVLPHDAATYWFGDVIGGRLQISRWSNQSLAGLAQRVTHGGGAAGPLWWVLVVLVGGPAFAAAVVAGRRGHRLLGACLCGTAGLLISPMTWSHHWVWVIPALGLAGCAVARGERLGWVAGGVLVVTFGWWPAGMAALVGRSAPNDWQPSGLLRMAPIGTGDELHWNLAELLYGDAYVIVGTLAVILAGVGLAARRGSLSPAADEGVSTGHGHR